MILTSSYWAIDDADVAVPQADVEQLAVFRGQMEKLEAEAITKEHLAI